MSRPVITAPLCALLSALLLTACGSVSETEQEVPVDALGTQELAMCSGLSVSNLAFSGASTYLGEMAGSGPWAVSAGANAVRLEYYIDNVLYASEERAGTSGTWYFSQTGISCGTHTLLVKAFPMVIDSAGNRTTCWGAPRSASQAITEACPGGTWVIDTYESCYDLYMTSCYTRSPNPKCASSAQAGGSCSPVGTYCWKVLSASTVAGYYCQ